MDQLHFLHSLVTVEEIKDNIAKGLLLIEDQALRERLTKFVWDGIDGSVEVIRHMAECREQLTEAQFRSRMRNLAASAVVARLRLFETSFIALVNLWTEAEMLFKEKVADVDEQNKFQRAMFAAHKRLAEELRQELEDDVWLDKAMEDPFGGKPKSK